MLICSDGSENEEDETNLLDPKEGERVSCVRQRVLLASKSSDVRPRRHTIFKTRCTIIINDKVCNVIIDSGSSENFVSKKLVTTINFKVKSLPNAYKIECVRKGEEASVMKICSCLSP